jgi:hypothetical protein
MRLSRSLFHLAALLATLALSSLTLSSCGDDQPFQVRTYIVGDHIELGRIAYTVFETQWLPQIGEGADARIPENRFFLIRISAANAGGRDLPIPNFTVENDKGTSYPELSNGDGVPQWMGYLRSAKPAQAVQGNALFDVPPGHYKLRIKDETGDKAALVDIPLSFGAETPDLAMPGPEKK